MVGRGRPKLPKQSRKDVVIQVRVSSAEQAEIAEGARQAGAPGASAWMRMLALQAARKLARETGGGS